MNDFRDRILAGKPAHDPLLRTKKPSPTEVGKAGEDKSLAERAINREASRLANHRDSDRHRLAAETVELTHGGRAQNVALINLSGGGAMVEGADGLKLWDRVDLRLGGSASLEAIVRWVRGGRFGLEFAHETRIEGGREELTDTLLAVIRRSFPDVALQAEAEVAAVQPPAAEPADTSDFHKRPERELRHPLIWSGLVHFDHDSSPVRLRNISSSGALIEVTVTYPVGAELLLDLAEAGSIFATVHWARGDQCGLKFQAPFDITALARAKPAIAGAQWVVPDYLRDGRHGGGPWASHWERADLGSLQRQLESTRSAIRRR